MDTDQIKTDLIDAINLTSDKKLLVGLSKMIKLNEQKEKLIQFTANQNAQIDRAIGQIENGEFLTEGEAENEVDSWLEE